jgi:GNAT superfamily N-acetyltransferase
VGELVEIRRAQLADCAAIADVLYRAFVEFRPLYTEGGFAATALGAEQIGIRIREAPVWVAVRGAVLIGTVSAVKKGDSIYIRGMAVLPDARGSGAGSRLLEQVESWAGAEACKRLFLSTTPFLASAIRLYERAGFRRTDDELHDLFGTPLFTMEKAIGR